MRTGLLAKLMALGAAALGAVTPLAAAPRQGAPVLMISIDGLRPDDVLHGAERGARVPTLAALARHGTYATGVRGILPTITYPNHTTLVTGVGAGRHGIASNLTFDPAGRNAQGWYWYASDIKVQTLWDRVHAAGRRTASIGWPVTVGLRAIDDNIPEYWRARTPDDDKLEHALATPGLLDALDRAADASLDMGDTSPAQDAVKARAAVAEMARKPWLFTLHLSSLDHQEHVYGPGSAEALAALAAIDGEVGAVVRAGRAARPDLVVAIVSDHGFAPVDHDINPAAALVEAGLMRFDDKGALLSWDAAPWPAGGSCAIVLARPDDAALRARVAALLARLAADKGSGIARVVDRAEIVRMGGAPVADFFLDARIGYHFTNAHGVPLVTPGTSKGTHGYFPTDPEMRATLILDGPALPRHGSLGDVRMIDIAPTLAGVMGVTLPDAGGRPLF